MMSQTTLKKSSQMQCSRHTSKSGFYGFYKILIDMRTIFHSIDNRGDMKSDSVKFANDMIRSYRLRELLSISLATFTESLPRLPKS